MWLKQRQAYVFKGLNNLLWNLCKNYGEIAQCNYFITILWKFSYMLLNFVFLNHYYWKQFSLICHFYSHVILCFTSFLTFSTELFPLTLLSGFLFFLKKQIGQTGTIVNCFLFCKINTSLTSTYTVNDASTSLKTWE